MKSKKIPNGAGESRAGAFRSGGESDYGPDVEGNLVNGMA